MSVWLCLEGFYYEGENVVLVVDSHEKAKAWLDDHSPARPGEYFYIEEWEVK